MVRGLRLTRFFGWLGVGAKWLFRLRLARRLHWLRAWARPVDGIWHGFRVWRLFPLDMTYLLLFPSRWLVHHSGEQPRPFHCPLKPLCGWSFSFGRCVGQTQRGAPVYADHCLELLEGPGRGILPSFCCSIHGPSEVPGRPVHSGRIWHLPSIHQLGNLVQSLPSQGHTQVCPGHGVGS
jgi:hypothetical protein